MRLTLVTETFPPEINGVARTLGRWVETFRLRGHEVQVIRPRQPQERGKQDLVCALPLSFYREVRLGLATPGRVRRLLGEFQPDVIHVATEGPLGLAALFAADRLGLPVVSSYHTHYDQYMGHYALGVLEKGTRIYLRWFHNRTCLTLAPTEATRGELIAHGYDNVQLWPRGVDRQRFHPRFRDEQFRSSLSLSPEDLLILYVGRLAPEKNLSALLHAFSQLRERIGSHRARNIRLALVGGGPFLARLQTEERPWMILPGYQNGADLSRWYASADIFAFTSLTETFGNVVLEAQASALPVVAFDCPAMRERIESGKDGFLVQSVEQFGEVLEALVEDVSHCRWMGTQGRRSAEQQDWGPIFDTLEERYHRIADAPKVQQFVEPRRSQRTRSQAEPAKLSSCSL
jgi:glycosyltransferase involved in cell wall biosynthesis